MLLFAILLSAGAPAVADPLAERDAAIRAAFIYRLAFFVSWQPELLPTDEADIVVCVVGPQPSHVFLRLSEESAQRRIRERRMQVRALADGAALSGCHIAYVEGNSRVKADDSQVVVVDSLHRLDDIGTLALVPTSEDGKEERLSFVADRQRNRPERFTFHAQLQQLLRFREEARGSGQ